MYPSRLKYGFLPLLVLLFLVSCGGPKLIIKKDVQVETLNVYFNYGPSVLPEIKAGFDTKIYEFIILYNNSRSSEFKLHRTDSPGEATLTVNLLATQLVSKSDQATGVIVSLLGLSLPFAMVASGTEFYVGFYYFPDVKSYYEISLSSDINGSDYETINRFYVTPGFLKTEKNQIKKHINKYDKFLKRLIREL